MNSLYLYLYSKYSNTVNTNSLYSKYSNTVNTNSLYLYTEHVKSRKHGKNDFFLDYKLGQIGR